MKFFVKKFGKYPAFYQTLAKQKGRGYIHESEGSVITDIWRSSTANYNTALRKAAEHETISRSRCREASVIPNPQVSMVLTGTFSQYHALTERTAFRWNDEWQQTGIVLKIRHGVYRKSLAVA